MAKNQAGMLLEKQFRASIPAGVYHHKVATPAPPSFRLGAVGELVRRLCAKCGEPVPEWLGGVVGRSSFTPSQPYDLFITAPLQGGPFYWRAHDSHGRERAHPAHPSLFFALEMKAVSSGRNLPFANIKESQERGLAEAAGACHISGFILWFPHLVEGGELFFLPIQVYLEYKAACGRASIPVEFLRASALAIERDLKRGTKNPYWNVRKFLSHFGGACP